MSGPLLSIEGLRVYYFLPHGAVRAVDGVSLYVDRGEVLGVAGESGCGKSTLAHAVVRLVRPPGEIVSGRIVFKGVDLLRLSEEEMRRIRGREIAMVFQDPNTYLNPVYTSGFQVAEVFEAHEGVGASGALERVVEIFRMVKMPDPPRRVHAYPHELSGGMKQRVLISIGIAARPSLLIADEPTSSLDVTIQAEVIDVIKEIQREMGMAMIFITHDLGLLSEIADRIAVMYAGKVVEVGPAQELMSDPLHPYTRALVDSLRLVRGSRLPTIEGSPPSLIEPPPGCRFHPRCPMATGRCRAEEPPCTDLGGGRTVSCHLYGGG